jgi:hypothetical protein
MDRGSLLVLFLFLILAMPRSLVSAGLTGTFQSYGVEKLGA